VHIEIEAEDIYFLAQERKKGISFENKLFNTFVFIACLVAEVTK
jgi:hypothetical protein